MTIQEINKQIKSKQVILNLHRAKYSPEKIAEIELELSNLRAMKDNPTLIEPVTEAEQPTIDSPVEETTVEKQADLVENTPEIKEAVPTVEKLDFDDDDEYLKSLTQPVKIVETEQKKVETTENETPDFSDDYAEPDKETAQKMENIKEKSEKERPSIELEENEDGGIDVKLSPKESAQVVVAFIDSFCRELLPGVYEWSIWSKEEQKAYRELSNKRRLFKVEQKAGRIEKDEVFIEEEFDIYLMDKFDRLQEYKDNAALTKEQIYRLELVWKIYFAKKKISLGPENALIMGMGSILLDKAAPVFKEKALEYMDKQEENSTDSND